MNTTMMMSRMMAEDCGAPELRNPGYSGMVRKRRWFRRLLGK